MSQQALEAVIGRAILNEAFRLALFADPEAALAGYDLTVMEVGALKQIDAESLDACGAHLARRVATVTHRFRIERGAAHGSTKEQTSSEM